MSKQDKPYYLRSTSPYDIEINLDESAFTKSSKIPRSPPPAPPKKELSKSSGLDILRSASTPNISFGAIPKNPLKQTRLCTSAEPISKPAISVPVTSSLSAEHIPKVPEISTIYEEIEVNSSKKDTGSYLHPRPPSSSENITSYLPTEIPFDRDADNSRTPFVFRKYYLLPTDRNSIR
ncbi:hypothetical protein QE152_g34779 [Popillia japonica]|uniref:Uncharacterized protein n=1 Tax=Popillia japonica TaxID=7064 RepID=A0AAW1IT65_POPJA